MNTYRRKLIMKSTVLTIILAVMLLLFSASAFDGNANSSSKTPAPTQEIVLPDIVITE